MRAELRSPTGYVGGNSPQIMSLHQTLARGGTGPYTKCQAPSDEIGEIVATEKNSAATPTSPNVVALCCDENLAWQAAFLIEKLATENVGADFDICCIIDKPFAPKHQAILEKYAQVIVAEGQFDLSQFTSPAQTSKSHQHVTLATFLRIFAFDLLTKEYEKVLYLDIDIYPEKGILGSLFDLENTVHPVAAVRDLSNWMDAPDPPQQQILSGTFCWPP